MDGKADAPQNDGPEKIDWLGVAFKKVDSGFHVGILLRDKAGPEMLWHLAWHFALRYEDLSSDYATFACGLPTERSRIVYPLLRRFAVKGTTNIPYSPVFDGEPYFSSDDFHFQRQNWLDGLTCATFVVAAFSAAGIQLLKVDEWPVRDIEDSAFRERVVTNLRCYPNGDADIERRVDAIKAAPSSARCKPLEVAACVVETVHPVPFPTAEKRARELELLLEGCDVTSE